MKISSKSIIVIVAVIIGLIILWVIWNFPNKEEIIIKNMSIRNITDLNEIYGKDNIEETKEWNIEKVHVEIKEGSLTKSGLLY